MCVVPFIVIIFINGLIRELKESGAGVEVGPVFINNLFFADDVVLVARSQVGLQMLITKAERYAVRWKFKYNIDKCKVMVFGGEEEDRRICLLDGKELEEVERYKYLGVIFDERLNWKDHKKEILDKARRKAYLMFGFGISRGLSTRSCVRLWEILVRPMLEYGAEVWGRGLGGSRGVTERGR